MEYRIVLTIVAAACLCVNAWSAPVVVFRDEFSALQAGRLVVIEDFQGFPALGPQTSPVQLANGTYASPMPSLSEHSIGGTRVLSDSCCRGSFATFTDFPVDTLAWSVDLYEPPFVARYYDIVVVGNSGTLELLQYENRFFFGHDPGFFGVYDPEGLVSVSIRGIGIDAFHSYSGITTVSVPEPDALTVLGSALLAFVGFSRFLGFKRI